MITVTKSNIEGIVRVIEVQGELLPGSAGNDEAAKIKSAIDDLRSTPEPIIFDFTKLNYTWGNYIAGLFISLRIKDKIDFNIVSTGETKKALTGLIQSGNLDSIYKIYIHDTIEDALRQFGRRP
jgi:hypothetical protein